MKPIYYNPIYNYNKSPIGAVLKGENIRFRISITEDYNIKNLKIIIHNDESGKYFDYLLEIEEYNRHYAVYKTEFKIEDAGIYWYHFEFVDCYGRHSICASDNLDAYITDKDLKEYQLSVFNPFKGDLNWYKGGIMYQILPDRFARYNNSYLHENSIYHENWNDHPNFLPINGEILNNDFFGGNLQGVIEMLPYLKKLNVNVIYFNPIFKAFSNHRYDTADYMSIDPMLGDDEIFHELCEKAKDNGIRIILDGVFNHTGSDSIYFNKKHRFPNVGAYESTDSPYYSWYRFIKYPDKYNCWWDFDTLPSVNQNSSYVDFITKEVMKKWLRLGASGFRLDVVDELNSSFVAKISKSLKEEDENNLLIGEVWEDASNKIAYGVRRKYFDGLELDSVMNYPLRNAIIDFIYSKNPQVLRNTMRSLINNYPPHVLNSLMNVLSTHDTSRILSVVGGINFNKLKREEIALARIPMDNFDYAVRRLKLAVTLQFTLPGVPCVFYGDEAGIEGYKDPFCRKTMPWGSFNNEIYDFYCQLSEIRKDEAFKEGIYNELLESNGIFAFRRDDIIVFINNTEYEYYYEIRHRAKDMFTNEIIDNHIRVESMTAKILKRC